MKSAEGSDEVLEEIQFCDLSEGSRIPKQHYAFHIRRYVFAASFVGGRYVLDIASGPGYGSSYLAKRGAEFVIGGDISRRAISTAVTKYGRSDRLAFLRLDATTMPFRDRSFDVVVSFETIEHVKEHHKFLSECSRVLKESGTFILSTPNAEVYSPLLGKPVLSFHVKEFGIMELQSLIKDQVGGLCLVYGQFLGGYVGLAKWYFRRILRAIIGRLGLGRLADCVSKIIFQGQYVTFRLDDMDESLGQEGRIYYLGKDSHKIRAPCHTFIVLTRKPPSAEGKP